MGKTIRQRQTREPGRNTDGDGLPALEGAVVVVPTPRPTRVVERRVANRCNSAMHVRGRA